MKTKLNITLFQEELESLNQGKKVLAIDSDDYPMCGDSIKLTIRGIKQPDYKKGFEILSEYFDSISDEEKPKVHKRLMRLGL